jgi:hypothetical protein
MKHIPAQDLQRLSATIASLLTDIIASSDSKKLRDVYMKALQQLLRRFTDNYWKSQLCVSEACWKKAREQGIDDIRKFEPRHLTTEQKRHFHLEHYLPVDDLRDDLRTIGNPTTEGVLERLMASPLPSTLLKLRKRQNSLSQEVHCTLQAMRRRRQSTRRKGV